MNLRALARSQRCMIRPEGVCNHDPATTVLAHYRLAGMAGVGRKPSDLLGAWAFSACHDAVDGRGSSKAINPQSDRLAHAEGVMRTLDGLERMGYQMEAV
ncbi:MAG: DUF1364 domain-containing protein [Nitrococcus sp.]|nr:DUF1364 domain-containing protein [Nitrococcus sp.]